MRNTLRALVVSAILIGCIGCSGGPSSTPSMPRVPREPAGGVQAAAISWATAFLTGTVADIQEMEGRQCTSNSPHFSPTLLAGYLKVTRRSMEQSIGIPLDRIRITGVVTRNVASTQGEAEVQYDLPSSKVGNDNWVTYQVEDGRWKESSCTAPIGGVSQTPSRTSG
jgi:hypothetical protein